MKKKWFALLCSLLMLLPLASPVRATSYPASDIPNQVTEAGQQAIIDYFTKDGETKTSLPSPRCMTSMSPPRSRSTTFCSTPTRTAPATTAPIPDGSTSSRMPKRSASSARRFPTAARRPPPSIPPSPATTSATTSLNSRWKSTAANRSAPTTPCTGWTTT